MEYRIPPGTEAVEKLEDFIVVNRLAPNTRIPSERDLCEMWVYGHGPIQNLFVFQ